MTTVIIGIGGAIGSSGRNWTFTVNERSDDNMAFLALRDRSNGISLRSGEIISSHGFSIFANK